MKYAVMNHFVSLVLTVLAVVALSIFYGLLALFLLGLVFIGAKFVVLSISVTLSEKFITKIQATKGSSMDDNERGSSVSAYSFIILFQPQTSASVNQSKTLVGIGVFNEGVGNKIVAKRIDKKNLREI